MTSKMTRFSQPQIDWEKYRDILSVSAIAYFFSPAFSSIICCGSAPRSIWISAKLLPLVSGITKNMKINPSSKRPANIQNTWPAPIAELSELNVLVITKLNTEFNMPDVEATKPLISIKQSSPAIIQGIGPKPRENAIINNDRETKGSHVIEAIIDESAPCTSCKKKNIPKITEQIHITSAENRSKILLPNLSTTKPEVNV